MARSGSQKMGGLWIIGAVVLYLLLNWLILPRLGVKT